MSLIGILVALVIICLIFWAIQKILAAFGIGDPIATVIRVVFVILVILWLLQALGLMGGFGNVRLH